MCSDPAYVTFLGIYLLELISTVVALLPAFLLPYTRLARSRVPDQEVLEPPQLYERKIVVSIDIL